MKSIYIFFVFFFLISVNNCKKSDPNEKPSWAKKDIRDYSDADLERLLDQWEVTIYFNLIRIIFLNL